MDAENIGLSQEEIMSKLLKFEQMAERINRFMEFCQPPNSEVESFQNIDNCSNVPSSCRSENVNTSTLKSMDQGMSESDEEICSKFISKNKGKGKSLKSLHNGNDDSNNDAYSVSTVNSNRDSNECNSANTFKTVPNDSSSEQSARSGSTIDKPEHKKNSEAKGSKLESYSARLARYNNKEETSPAVNPELADILGKAITTHVGYSEEMKNLLNKYKRPDNIPNLVAPRLNIEIFKLVPKEAQHRDIEFQELQKNIVRALCPLVSAIDELQDMKSETAEKLHDAAELLAFASMDINKRRRDALKPFMQEAKYLTNKEVPITNFLFGDNVEAEFKKIELANKLNDSMKGRKGENKVLKTRQSADDKLAGSSRGNNRGGRFKPYFNRFEFVKRKAQDFLGQRKGNAFSYQKNKFQNKVRK